MEGESQGHGTAGSAVGLVKEVQFAKRVIGASEGIKGIL